MTDVLAVGYYGKLPLLGDFVSRRVDSHVVEAWDTWLQHSIAESRQSLGDRWLDLYLTAPMWRFFAHAGVLDELPVAGVMFPSVDRVGRYFPFTVFTRLPEQSVGLVVADRCVHWFERVEDLVLTQLDDGDRSLEDFDVLVATTSERLAAALHSVPPHLGAADFLNVMDQVTPCLHLSLGERVDVGPTALAWLDQVIERSIPGSIFWWSSGSAHVQPSWLITRGLPEPKAFCAMIAGSWQDWPWAGGDTLQIDTLQMGTLPDVLGSPVHTHIEGAGSTHPGNVREENQDAFIARPEIGLWAVADGMGGHSDGQLASQATRDALAALEPPATFPEFVRAVRGTLDEVNEYLYSLSFRPVNPTVIGTTVVVMLIREGVGVCLWAGDSRLYRLRQGALDQLTVDHSESAVSGAEEGAASSNVITRALGGRQGLDLEQATFDVQPGDRFLLCSDGLYRELPAERLQDLLSTGEAIDTVDRLVAQTLLGSASDNVTAVVVDVKPDAS